MKNILLVGFGGGLGSIARYLCQRAMPWYPHLFPTGTFVVNMIGCFLIGLFYGLAEKENVFTPDVRLLLTTGFCGGYTTFSTFAFENVILYKNDEFLYFGLYIAASVILGIVATFCGILLLKFF